MKNFETTFQYFIHLLQCGISGEMPEQIPDFCRWDDIIDFSYNHSVEVPVYMAAKKLKPDVPRQTSARWKEIYFKAISKDSIQLEEYKKIVNALTKSGVELLPFKGIVLKSLYPLSCMRSMGDIDIYYQTSEPERVKTEMEKLGYVCTAWHDEKVLEDVFCKPPVMYVELHSKIFDEDVQWSEYFSDVLSRAYRDDNTEDLYFLNDEDFYIQLIMHAAKHFQFRGFGIKSILDLYIFEKVRKPDFGKIEQVLEKFGLLKFYKLMTECAAYWFGNGEYSDHIAYMEKFIANSFDYINSEKAAFDSVNDRSSSKSIRFARFQYIMRMIFVPKSTIVELYPAASKHTLLLPFYYIKRCIHIILNPKNVKKNIKASQAMNSSSAEFYAFMEQIAGLKIGTGRFNK